MTKRLLWTVFFPAVVCWAQLDRGTLTGLVTDPSSAIIPFVKITAIHVETGVTNATLVNESGNYTLVSLPIGTYRVEFETPGFKKSVRNGVTLASGATVRLDVTLEIGSVGESVQVSARSTPIETDSSRVATSINTKLVQDLPLQVSGQIRSVFDLAAIAPQTKSSNGFTIAGGQGSAWEMSMDGMPVSSGTSYYQTQRAPLSTVPIDAIAEFNVETGGMKAQYGRSMGTVTMETKSGANQVHGSGFDFIRNNALDARGFFAAAPPVLKQHDFGGTLGGPIVIPKIYRGRNKTFFFASYQGFRNRAGSNPQYLTIPTEANYKGDFSGWTRNGVLVPIYDPASIRPSAPGSATNVRDPFPGNVIPLARFSQVAVRYIGLRPAGMLPNTSSRSIDPVQNYFTQQGSAVNPWNKGSFRLDHALTSKDRLSLLFLKGQYDNGYGADGPPGLPVPLNGSSINTFYNTSYRVAWDRTMSSSVINSLRASYQREMQWLATMNSIDPNAHWNDILKIPNTPGPDRALTQLSFTSYTGWSGSSWGLDRGGNVNLTDDLTFIRGVHTFKAGGFYAKDRWDGGGQHRPNGSFTFSQLATSIPNDQTNNSGNAFASFLLGYPSTDGLETPRLVRQVYQYFGGYFQDDWKVTPRLTLNLGLRYEYTTPVGGGAFINLKTWEDLSAGTLAGFMNFDPTVPNPGAGGRLGAVIFSGDGPGRTPGSLFDAYKKAWAPRLGLAYRLNSKTVVRAYGGRVYAAVKTTGASTHFDGLILNTNYSSSDNSQYDFPTLLDKGITPFKYPPFIDATIDNDTTTSFWQRSDSGRPSTLDSWNVDIQRELTSSSVLTVSYYGSKGTHLASSLKNFDQIDPKYITQFANQLGGATPYTSAINFLKSSVTSASAKALGIAIPYPGFTSTVQRALSPFPQYQSILTNGGQPQSVGERAGNSTYHAMVVKFDKRYSNGLTLLLSYTLSKQISDSDSALISTGGPLDTYNPRLEKGLSATDQTHDSRFAFSYDLPVGNKKKLNLGSRLLDTAFGEWNVAGFFTYASGFPLSVSSGLSPIGTGSRVYITSYDNWRAPVAGDKFDPAVDVWFNKNAFNQGYSADFLNGNFGNASRNNPKLRSPWNFNENFSLAKNFPVTERVKIAFRFEGFNVLNRVRWGGANGTLSSTTFGKVTTQGNTPRRMQASLKVSF